MTTIRTIKNPALLNISLFVIILHCIALAWAALSIDRTMIPKNSRPLVVKTIIPVKNNFAPVPVSVPNLTDSRDSGTGMGTGTSMKLPLAEIAVKKDHPKPKPKAKTIDKESPKVEKKPKHQELLAKAQANIDKIQQKPEKLSAMALSVPQLSVSENSYQDKIANMLKLILRFPEFGQVQIELTLDRMGNIKKMQVIKAESERNRVYIENAIPAISFPPFGHHYPGASEHTFPIMLENEFY